MTNRESPKAQHIDAHSYASLCFYWRALGEQVRVDGPVEPLTDAEADAYWARRRRSHQLGDWASNQSHELDSLETLQARYDESDEAFAAQDVPRPPSWGGFRVVPDRVEFWVQGEALLHERVLYEHDGTSWRRRRLQP
ncbi:MAG: pyridoxal 5'-phosphate synthase [Candidatus Bipolaricaulia bacterium]